MRYFYAFVMAMLCFCSFAASQTILRGKLVDEKNNRIGHAAVSIKETKTSVSANENGEFLIQISSLPARLVIAAVGYDVKEVLISREDTTTDILISLKPSSAMLNEVVVVGYGKARKRDLSWSTSSRASGITATTSNTKKSTPEKLPTLAVEKEGEYTNTVRSQILTAGELSDFKKWELWKDYNSTEFQQWSRYWEIAPTRRYCVQVQNAQRYALPGEKVYLINLDKKDTAWEAVTDNTGKAELWSNFEANTNSQFRYALMCGGEINNAPVMFENGINNFTLKKDCAKQNVVDVAFVVDATSSMQDEIRYLQAELASVIGKSAANNKDKTLRIGSVFYRDRGDQYITRTFDFKSDTTQLIQFIRKQSAEGGGDLPEAVEEALTSALDSLQWDAQASSKILFLVLDAPPHEEAKNKMNSLTRRAAQKGIRIVPVVCSGIDKSTEFLMRSVALATNGSYVFLTDHSGIGNPHIKPTTDHFDVELLNTLLQRIIREMTFTASCHEKEKREPDLLQQNKTVQVSVFPNPTSGRIQVQSSEKIKEIFITDFAGKVLERIAAKTKSTRWEADLSRYPSGTYLLRYFIDGKGWNVSKVLLIN